MNAANLVADLDKRGVILKVVGEQLRVEAPNGVLSPELKGLLRAHKTEIVALMRSRQTTGRDKDLLNLIAQRESISITWNKMFDKLETMNQDSPEFESLFVEWEKVDQEYKLLCDRIDCVEFVEQIRQGTALGTAVPNTIIQGSIQR